MAASKILRSTYHTGKSGITYWIDENGKAIQIADDEQDYIDEQEMRAEAAREAWERDRYEHWDRGY